MDGPHVVVVGVMGAGKTTIGRAVAQRLHIRYRDSDEDLEVLTGRTGAQLAADPHMGVDVLHKLEEASLLGALADPEPTVITAAAWVVESEWCRMALERRALVAWLDAPPEVLWTRAVRDDHRRTMGLEEFERVAEARRDLFEEVTDVRLDAEQPVHALVRTLAEHLTPPVPLV